MPRPCNKRATPAEDGRPPPRGCAGLPPFRAACLGDHRIESVGDHTVSLRRRVLVDHRGVERWSARADHELLRGRTRPSPPGSQRCAANRGNGAPRPRLPRSPAPTPGLRKLLRSQRAALRRGEDVVIVRWPTKSAEMLPELVRQCSRKGDRPPPAALFGSPSITSPDAKRSPCAARVRRHRPGPHLGAGGRRALPWRRPPNPAGKTRALYRGGTTRYSSGNSATDANRCSGGGSDPLPHECGTDF